MKERPILFSGPMVRALLDGRKTQTRRVVKDPGFGFPLDGGRGWENGRPFVYGCTSDMQPVRIFSPYGEPGDRLWVRETFYCDHFQYPSAPIEEMRPLLEYREGHDCRSWEAGCPCRDENGRGSWRPSIHMPRWASRITLEVIDVRVERVQDITDAEALAEGVTNYGDDSQFPPGFSMSTRAALNWRPTHEFRDLWDSINGKRPGCAWSDNPWVWAVTFKVLRPEVP